MLLDILKLNKFKKLVNVLIVVFGLFSLIWIFPILNNGHLVSKKNYSQIIYDRDDKILRITLSGDEKYRLYNTESEIDKNLQIAFLNKEDKYFYYHFGFNPVSLVRAFYKSFILKSSYQGASTITMQVVRLLYPESTKTLTGKINQILLSIQLELLYSKQEILNAYLNWAPFGSNIEGVESACLIFFKKKCMNLSQHEINFLVQIPQNPQKYSNIANINKKELPFLAPHFVDYILQSNLNQKKLKTTLDYGLQFQIQQISEKYFNKIKHFGVKNYSLMLVDTRENEVLAYLGSADYYNQSIKGQVDSNRSLKPPGSTLKPFIYALALQQGLIHEKSLLKDTKMSFAGINPENFDEQFLGPLSSDQALVLSRNLPAADLASKLKSPTLYEFLKFKSSMKFRDEKYYGLSLALGGVEFSNIDLIKLYSALSRLGQYRDLKFTFLNSKKIAAVNKINDQTEQILSSEASYIVLQMLKKNQRNESATLNDLIDQKIPVAWKTGTSKSYKDAWTIGLIGHLALVVWFGDNDREMNPALMGRSLSAPLFFQIYDFIRNNTKLAQQQSAPYWNSKIGLNVKLAEICSVSKKLKTANCQHKTEQALFISSVSPIEKCQIHRKLFYNLTNHKYICPENINIKSSPQFIEKIVEVWPDDLIDLYEKSGLRKELLSSQKIVCHSKNSVSTDPVLIKNLIITSPQENIDYLIQLNKTGLIKNKIQLRALSESDSRYMDWFVNQSYIGRTFKNDHLFFDAQQPGRYTVFVKDDIGRSQTSYFNVKVISQQ